MLFVNVPFSWFCYLNNLEAKIRPQLVTYNAFLNGQFKDNFHEFGFSEIKHLVAEAFAGFGATLTNCKRNFSTGILA
jgi:hypothetical protein